MIEAHASITRKLKSPKGKIGTQRVTAITELINNKYIINKFRITISINFLFLFIILEFNSL